MLGVQGLGFGFSKARLAISVLKWSLRCLEGNLLDYKLYEFCYKFFSTKVKGLPE